MYEFPFELDDFQKEACEHISNGKSVVVCAPTGAGKTVIAQHAIHCALEKNQRVFYTTPLKALSNQKYNDFSMQYGTERVGLLTGDTSINRGAQIVVMTTEVFRNMLYGTNFGSVSDNMKNVRYVVLDEVHYMNDEQRGTVWEESIIYCPTNVQIIALSATVANCDKLTEWINTVHSKTELVNTDFRPVPLRFYYFDSSQPNTILPLLTPSGALNNKIKPEKKQFRRGKPVQKRNTVKDVVRVLHEKNMLPAIYFTFSRKKCDEQMEKCAELCLVSPKEQEEIRQIVDDYIAENPYLYRNKHIEYLLQGVASHHAGLLPGWKVLVEKLFQKGLIKVALNIFAFFIAIIATLILFKPISNLVINNTQIDDKIKEAIIITASRNQEQKESNENNGFIQEYIENEIKSKAEEVKNSAIESIAGAISIRVIEILTWIILFIVIRIALILLKFLSETISEIPIIKQFNEIGGIVYGIIKSAVIIIFILTIIFIISSIYGNGKINDAIEESYVTKFLYNNNIVVNYCLLNKSLL